jgi:Arc/MetJ-type ribon-helix-helix transcriptional regulator
MDFLSSARGDEVRAGMMICHTTEMSTVKVAISIDELVLQEVDQLVRSHVYPNRSKAIQDAVADKLARLRKTRLLRECRKLKSNEEQAAAEEWLSGEEQWPAF